MALNNYHTTKKNQINPGGWISADVYSTAWVALVPHKNDLSQPAWPQTLDYIRDNQLPDGGWGEPIVYYVHARIISTLACLYALSTWKNPDDELRIANGLTALHQYAYDLQSSPIEEPIGFEILLPSLLARLAPFNLALPENLWSAEQQQITALKMQHIGKLEIDYDNPRTWWVNMEVLPDQTLQSIDKRILNKQGAIAISVPATAAYLRALRLAGDDCLEAELFLSHTMRWSGNGVGVLFPIDNFELIWALDGYMRAGLPSPTPIISNLLKQLNKAWHAHPIGLAHSTLFPINDGDDTAAGYTVLRWGGYEPDMYPLCEFWDDGCFSTYKDERHPSVSANIHALSALKLNAKVESTQKRTAVKVTEWLRAHFDKYNLLDDKWHISPLYPTTHAIHSFVNWDNSFAQQCIDYVLSAQDETTGGWGVGSRPTLEETSHAVLGLIVAHDSGLLPDDTPLRRAAAYFKQQNNQQPTERLWIGKTLYCPVGVVQATVDAAKAGLTRLGINGFDPKLYYIPELAAETSTITI